MTIEAPVITIDGPGGTGKGTISQMLAKRLGWHFLDSGVLYRVLAFAAQKAAIGREEEFRLAALAMALDVKFVSEAENSLSRILLNQEDVSALIREESVSQMASAISALPKVREALLDRQRAFRQMPGLVTDGRDMGTVVFPDAKLKFFLDATPEERAKRRYNQLKEQGINVSLENVLKDLIQRDERDRGRAIAPLKPAEDAILIDTTSLSVEQVFDRVIAEVKKRVMF